MRTLSMRQFQRNFYKELQEIPFIVVSQAWTEKDGKNIRGQEPKYIVIPYSENVLAILEKSTEFTTVIVEETQPEKPTSIINRLFRRP